MRPPVVADHDAQVCDGAGGFGMGQRQRKPGPVRRVPCTRWEWHTRFLGARGQSEQHQSCYCDEYGWHPKIFTRHSPDGLIAERKLAPFRLCRQHRSAAAFALGADASACSAAVSCVQAWRTDILRDLSPPRASVKLKTPISRLALADENRSSLYSESDCR